MKAIQIINPNVDYIITEKGHYVAYIKKDNRSLGNIIPRGLTNSQLEIFLRHTYPKWTKGKITNLEIACQDALIELFDVDDITIIYTLQISSTEKEKFLSIISNWENITHCLNLLKKIH